MSPTRVGGAGTTPVAPSNPPQAPASPGTAPASPGAGTHPVDTFAGSTAGAGVFPGGARRWGSWAWTTAALTAPAALDAALAFQKRAGANELYFNAYLAQLDAALAGRPGYGGCALHDLDTLRHLPP